MTDDQNAALILAEDKIANILLALENEADVDVDGVEVDNEDGRGELTITIRLR